MKHLAEHQVRIMGLMDQSPVLGIFAEAGTGKTMIALAWLCDHLLKGDIENALVVCPASLVPSWQHAITRMDEFGYTQLEIETVRSSVSISTYGRLWISDGTVRGYKKYRLRDNIDRHWDVCIVDESHRLGDHSSVQTKTALKLAKQCDRRYIMTGTPDSGNYTKLYGQIKFLDPDIWKSYYDFDRRYVVTHDHFNRPVRFDVDGLDMLKRAYGTVARLRECYDMPSMTECDIPVELHANKVYKDFMANKVSEYGFDVKVAGTGVLKALQVCSGFYLDGTGHAVDVGTDKYDVLCDLLQSFDDKTVIFCKYIASLDGVESLLKKMGISYHRFDGSTKEPLWKDFQKDDKRVFLSQYQRGSEGIDLFAACRMIFFEPTFSALLLEQAKARIMRKGQISPCVYYHIYVQDTIEEKVMRNVRNGVDVSRLMLDRWASDERKQA